MSIKRPSGQSGFTLVELMVALLIGLVVIGAVGTLYLSSMESARFNTGIQRVQENGRFAIDMISRSARMAGYDNPADGELAFPGGLKLKGTVDESSTAFSLTGLKAGSDTAAFTYQGGADIIDCQGQPMAANEYVTSLYAINSNNTLICATLDSGGNTVSSGVEIAEGVEDMQVLYGVDADGTKDGYANRYVNAGSVSDWNRVVSMRITLLVSSVADALPVAETVCIGCITFQGSNDRQIRAEYETTIAVRNFIVKDLPVSE